MIDLETQATGAQRFFAAARAAGRPTVSGGGSLMETTSEVRSWLPAIIGKYGIRTMADVPCGDGHWMAHVDLGGVYYVGYDLLADVVGRAAFGPGRGKDLGRTYRVHNAITTPPDRADLILCRDFLVHLSYEHALAVLENFRRSGSRYLAVNTFPYVRNEELAQSHAGWGWRPLDLESEPFDLGPAIDGVMEVAAGEGWERWMKLFEL